MTNVKIYDSLPSLKEEDIIKVGKELGIILPNDYQNFLLSYNGGYPDPNIFPIEDFPFDKHGILDWFLCVEQTNIRDLIRYAKKFRDRLPLDLLPIGHDPGGNLICLSVSGSNQGKVYFWFHEGEAGEDEIPDYRNVYFVADSFTDLLNTLSDLHESP